MLYLNGTVIEKFLVVLKQKKILGNIFLFSEQIIHRKQSLGFAAALCTFNL